MATDKYDLHTIDYSVQGWDSILTTDMEKLDDVIQTRLLITLGETVAEGEALYLNSVDDKWYKAQANGTKQPSHGVACENGVLDDIIRLQVMGELTVSTWNWTNISAPIYLDPSTAGAMTQTNPGHDVQIMGYALTATKIRVLFLKNIDDDVTFQSFPYKLAVHNVVVNSGYCTIITLPQSKTISSDSYSISGDGDLFINAM